MKKMLALVLSTLMAAALLTGCGDETVKLDPEDPVTLTLWHVYGEQADSPMNRLVDEFNETVGREEGVIIDVALMTNSSQIGQKLLDAQAGIVGAEKMPDLFFGHPSNAAAIGTENLLDWNDCFTEEELAAFVPAFLEEGTVDSCLSVLPVSKSTHLLFLNGSQFARFSADTGVTYEELATWDGFFAAAEQFYEWSGGQPFCAMDFLMRAVELNALSKGSEIAMQDGWYDFSDPALRESWMQFARALVQGHIVVSDLYSNTQVMTGEVAAGLGSSAAILYYNDTVTYADNTTEPMNLHALPMPEAAGGEKVVTQAGVGLCACSTTPEKAAAASLFAHWLTEGERNLDFVVQTGYLPVNDGAFEAIEAYEFPDEGREDLYQTIKTVRETCRPVTEPAFAGYYERVNALYALLRAHQADWAARCAAGESAETLAEESFALFQSVQ